MRRVTFIEALGYIFKFLVTVFVILFIVSVFVSFKGIVQMHRAEKFAVEIKEVLSTRLVSQRNTFLVDKLDEINGKNIEPYRSCDYGYKVEIKCIDGDACSVAGIEEEYSFGYNKQPINEDDANALSRVKPRAQKTFPVVLKKGDKSAIATMKIYVYYSVLTQLSCMIEKAQKTVSVQSTQCLLEENGKCEIKANSPLDIRQNEDVVCSTVQGSDDTYYECKYLPDTDVRNYAETQDSVKKKYLKILPINKNLPGIPDVQECSAYENFIAHENDEILIVLCKDDSP